MRHFFNMGSIHSTIQKWSDAFHQELDDEDIRELRRAKNIFLFNSFLPGFLYYIGLGTDARVKFPATISWTIRAGVPKYVNFTYGRWLGQKFGVLVSE